MTHDFRLHRSAALRWQPRRPRQGPVITVQVDRDVWATALDLADGDVRRLHVVDAENVLVLNRPRCGGVWER
jgi:hypothetical protein